MEFELLVYTVVEFCEKLCHIPVLMTMYFFMVTVEIPMNSVANFHCQFEDRHMNL